MRVVTIADTKGEVLAFDLVDILRLLEPELAHSEWTLSGTECAGDAAEELHRIDDSGERVSGPNLLAARATQAIDGEFTAYRPGPQPWVTIRAIDSSTYDVLSADDSVIARIKARFNNVTEIPADQYFGRQT